MRAANHNGRVTSHVIPARKPRGTHTRSCRGPVTRSSDTGQTLLAFTEKRAAVFAMEKLSARGHYRRSVLPFPWSIDMYAPVIHV